MSRTCMSRRRGRFTVSQSTSMSGRDTPKRAASREIAIMLAAMATGDLLSAGAGQAEALTGGYSIAFWAGAACAATGAGLGFALGYSIVHNINWLHTKLGELTGRAIWDPEVYAFDIIPNTMDPDEVTVILIVAVVASVLGALVPTDMDNVAKTLGRDHPRGGPLVLECRVSRHSSAVKDVLDRA